MSLDPVSLRGLLSILPLKAVVAMLVAFRLGLLVYFQYERTRRVKFFNYLEISIQCKSKKKKFELFEPFELKLHTARNFLEFLF